MKKTTAILFFVMFGLSAAAFLPPQAEYRGKEVLEYRQRKKAEYERAKQDYHRRMVAEDRLVQARLSLPPWTASKNAAIVVSPSRGGTAAVDNPGVDRTLTILSVLFLIVVGVLAARLFIRVQREEE